MLRLTVDGGALAANWRWLAGESGSAACGAAVKANAYGLGAREAVPVLLAASCRDFFVATWAEAAEIADLIGDARLSVLHGVQADDMALAAALPMVRPVLNTPEQVALWRESAAGRPCDIMVDTGMNRLGLAVGDVAGGMLDGLAIGTLMSHLACADEDSAMNRTQLDALLALDGKTSAERLSIANSAGISLGPDYALGLTRPGLALYGGIARPEADGRIAPVVGIEARIVQRRRVAAGDSIGYGATHVATGDTEVAILNIGYADGYLRGFSATGMARAGDADLPVLGRVSMDLTAVSVDTAPQLSEGDWVAIDYDLPRAAAQSGLSQYELLTTLGGRHQRIWR